ncbi:MAG TPA: hypothetical protein VFU21_10830, partial [Kofleriaceae bacterium]|nr:hypothetical protein [Kofleriaceae bacterium]
MRPLLLALLLVASAPAADASVRRGLLSGPTRQAPAEVARATLAGTAGLAADALSIRSQRALARGSLVAVGQSHRGLPVVGTSAAVRLDEQGRVRWVRSSLRAISVARVTP